MVRVAVSPLPFLYVPSAWADLHIIFTVSPFSYDNFLKHWCCLVLWNEDKAHLSLQDFGPHHSHVHTQSVVLGGLSEWDA